MNHSKSDHQEESLKTNMPFCFSKDRKLGKLLVLSESLISFENFHGNKILDQ